jgi:hypothetical protein
MSNNLQLTLTVLILNKMHWHKDSKVQILLASGKANYSTDMSSVSTSLHILFITFKVLIPSLVSTVFPVPFSRQFQALPHSNKMQLFQLSQCHTVLPS